MKPIILILLSLTLPLISADTSDYTFEGEVLILNKNNFADALEEFEYLLINFCDPTNEKCQKLAPEFASAAERMAENNPAVKLAQVDFSTDQEIAEKYYIESVPTLKFFRQDGEGASEFHGYEDSRGIINWLSRRTFTRSLVVKSMEELEYFVKTYEAVALFIGTLESSGYEDYASMVIDYEDVKSLRTTDSEILSKYGAKENNLIMFNTFGKEHHLYKGDPGSDEYVTFISDYKDPFVLNFTNTVGSRVFQAGESAVILFVGDDVFSQKAAEVFKNVAPDMKGQILFAIAEDDDRAGGKVASHVGVEKDEFPCIRLVTPNDDNKKYMFEGMITEQNIKKFVNDALNGELKPYLKSQKVPAEPYDGHVKIIVAKTFNDIVMDESKDVLVKMYTPWCNYCKSMAPGYERLAARFKDLKSLVVAQLDGNANEIEDLHIGSYPMLMLWKKGNKGDPEVYHGNREEEDIIRFLKEHGAIPSEGAGKDDHKPDVDL